MATTIVSGFFILASIVFAATNDESSVETLAIVSIFILYFYFIPCLLLNLLSFFKPSVSKNVIRELTENGKC